MTQGTLNTDFERRGQPLLPGAHVHVSSDTAHVAVGPQPGKAHLQLIQENGIVKAIEVTCSCGERILLHCEYQ